MEIIWRPIALDDLEQARRYIAEHNPRAAERLWNRILRSIELLYPASAAPAALKAPANWLFREPLTSSPTRSLARRS